jgi:hypothetical protein
MLAIAVRTAAIAAAGILLWSVIQQQPDTTAMNDTPNVTTYATTHVCGDHVCGH